MKKVLILGLLVIALSSCDSRETSRYDVYFWAPRSDKEVHVANVQGLSSCQFAARSYAAQMNGGSANYDWSYICCLNKPHNSCAEKHR